MASTSASRPHNSGASRIATAASTISSDSQSMIAEIRRFLGSIKSLAVELEKAKQSDQVKELEDAVVELLEKSDECAQFSQAVQTVGNTYQPSDQPTDFKKVLEGEVAKIKVASLSVPQRNPLYRQFKEAVWNVHHAGEPMPGEEQEDIVMTSTQNTILNTKCPITGRPVTELQNPVRCVDCKHIYEKDPIMHYIRTHNPQPKCPVAGCPKTLRADRVVCDPLLGIDIDEMRSAENAAAQATMFEDFTDLNDD